MPEKSIGYPITKAKAAAIENIPHLKHGVILATFEQTNGANIGLSNVVERHNTDRRSFGRNVVCFRCNWDCCLIERGKQLDRGVVLK